MADNDVYDEIAGLIRVQLDVDDEAQPRVRNDVEFAPEDIPSDLWRTAVIDALRQRDAAVAHERTRIVDALKALHSRSSRSWAWYYAELIEGGSL